MSNRITEGFDWFPSGKSDSERTRLWGANHNYLIDNILGTPDPWESTTGRFDFGKCAFIDAGLGSISSTGYFMTVMPLWDDATNSAVPLSEGYFGCAMRRMASSSPGGNPSVGVYDGVLGEFQFTVQLDELGIVRVYRGATGASHVLLGSSKIGSFYEDQWFYLECYFELSDSSGVVEVRVNTVPVVQLPSVDNCLAASTVADCFVWGACMHSVGANVDAHIDDIYFNDTDGATCNTWLGNVRVKSQLMIADGATNDFSIGGTSPAATNWQSVLNSTLDDTKYVYSPNVGDIDLYTPDPNLNSPLVHVLQVRMGLRQDDATQRVARAVIRIGATNYVDNLDNYTNQTYSMYFGKWELNPVTGVQFTGAEVNGLEVGVKVQA